MLSEFAGINLPYPPTGAALIISEIFAEEDNLEEYLKFDYGKKRIELPMKLLTSDKSFWKNAENEGHVVKGTNIHWKVDSENFCFWLE